MYGWKYSAQVFGEKKVKKKWAALGPKAASGSLVPDF